VAEFQSLIMNIHLSPYFFLVVFLAFFAGAFFVAMDSSPPFIRRGSIYKKLHEAGHTGNMVAVSQIRRGHSCPRLSHSRDFKKATSSWLLSSWLLSS